MTALLPKQKLLIHVNEPPYMTALQNNMMKKLVYTLLLALVAPAAWAVDPGHYTDPNQLPEAFEWNFLRDDYYKPNINGEETKVRTQEITVIWDPTYINSKGSYGKLTIENFYNHERLKKVCNLTFDNDTHNANFQWNDDFTVDDYHELVRRIYDGELIVDNSIDAVPETSVSVNVRQGSIV